MSADIDKKIENKIKEDLSPTRNLTGFHLKLVAIIAITWSLFQLWYASPFPFWLNFGMFKGLPARAIHLGFALLLAFLIFPYARGKKVNFIDILIAITGAICCLYIYVFYDQLVDRGGILLKINLSDNFTIPIELILGIIGILILLEATRRVIGVPLVVIAVCFLLFSYFGQYAPDIISHGGLSLKRLVGFQWFDQEAIFGIPIGVSVDFIFLFVLFGALLETAGGGKYFLEWCKEAGNDLITPHPEFGFPGLKDGDSWCVCAGWYARALEAGKGCPIYLKKTHKNTLKLIPIETLKKFAIDLS